jgi:hypothetical protein
MGISLPTGDNINAAVTYMVRASATDDGFASATVTVAVPARAAAPNAVYNATSDAITGVTAAMQFTTPTETWQSVTGTSITREILTDGERTVSVRVAATPTARASQTRQVAIPRADVAAPGAQDVEINFNQETLTGVTSAMEYRRAGAAAWTAVPANVTSVSIATLIPAAGQADTALEVRFRAVPQVTTGANQTACRSAYQYNCQWLRRSY